MNKYKPYYQQMNITPKEYPSNNIDGDIYISVGGSSDNPRIKSPPPPLKKLPFAEVVLDSNSKVNITSTKNYFPNVGNNMENSWNGLDYEVVDDLGWNSDQSVDNNDEVDIDSLQIPSQSSLLNSFLDSKNNVSNELPDVNSAFQLNEEYILFLNQEVFSGGSFDFIQKEVEKLLYGEHESFKEEVLLENISVYKKMDIKIGILIGDKS